MEAKMLHDLKIDELLDKVDSRYGLAVASAKRARQINEYTSTLGLNDALGIEELRQDKLDVSFRQPSEDMEEIGAADADDFISPPAGPGVPQQTDLDSGAPGDEGAA